MRLDEIKPATNHDEALQLLKQVILQGWPANKSSLPAVIAVSVYSFALRKRSFEVVYSN